MAALPGVTGARLNFGAATLTVEGDVPVPALLALARAEQLQAVREGEERPAPPTVQGEVRRLLIAGALLAAGVLAGWLLAGWSPLAAPVLYALAIAVGGWPTARKGLRSLRRLRFDSNVLMTVAVAGAALIGQWSEGAVVAFLYNLSEALEAYAMNRARGAIGALVQLAPRTARLLDGREVPVDAVAVGEMLLVRPGERIALDGVVRAGISAVDQAAITGEAMPVTREVGDPVYAGSINGEGALEVAVTRLVRDTTLARVIHQVEEAQAQKAPAQRFVDRFARWYTPAVMLAAALVMVVPPLFFHRPWDRWIYAGLALLVLSCPCALVVSTPVALVSGIANAARYGVLIKGGLYLEQAGHLQAVAFDKTGTLTRGRPVLTDVVSLGEAPPARILALAAAVEARSEHPLARAVVQAARDGGLALPAAADFTALPGRGAAAVVEGVAHYAGTPRLFSELGALAGDSSAVAAVERLEAAGKTAVLLGTAERLLGVLAVADELRASSVAALQELRRLGVRHAVMLTGDSPRTAAAVAAQAGLAEYRAGLLPADKVTAIGQLQQEYGLVAMVGDGINDAPALAAAGLGIAMGGAGSGVALETAGAVLMADDLSGLPFLVRQSRATLAVIRQNIGLALGLKLLAVLAVIPGWLTLWLAVIADMGGTILVTLNAVRLLRLRPGHPAGRIGAARQDSGNFSGTREE